MPWSSSASPPSSSRSGVAARKPSLPPPLSRLSSLFKLRTLVHIVVQQGAARLPPPTLLVHDCSPSDVPDCPICLFSCGEGSGFAVTSIACGHSFCLPCHQKNVFHHWALAEEGEEKRRGLKCPVCGCGAIEQPADVCLAAFRVGEVQRVAQRRAKQSEDKQSEDKQSPATATFHLVRGKPYWEDIVVAEEDCGDRGVSVPAAYAEAMSSLASIEVSPTEVSSKVALEASISYLSTTLSAYQARCATQQQQQQQQQQQSKRTPSSAKLYYRSMQYPRTYLSPTTYKHLPKPLPQTITLPIISVSTTTYAPQTSHSSRSGSTSSGGGPQGGGAHVPCYFLKNYVPAGSEIDVVLGDCRGILSSPAAKKSWRIELARINQASKTRNNNAKRREKGFGGARHHQSKNMVDDATSRMSSLNLPASQYPPRPPSPPPSISSFVPLTAPGSETVRHNSARLSTWKPLAFNDKSRNDFPPLG